MLVSSFPDHYAQVIAYRAEHDCSLLEAEQSVLGVDHVQAGVALAERWNFSDTMRQAIGNYLTPEAPGAGFLAALIHVANAIVCALDLAQAGDDMVPPVSLVAWNALGLSEETYLQLFRETELRYEEITAALLH